MSDKSTEAGEFNAVDLNSQPLNGGIEDDSQVENTSVDQIIIPNAVHDVLLSNLKRQNIIGAKEPYEFRGFISTDGPYGCYIFFANGNQRPIVIIHSEKGATLANNLNSQPWTFTLQFFAENPEIFKFTPQDIFEAYKQSQIRNLQRILNINHNLEITQEDLNSNTIDLVNVYSRLEGAENSVLKIQVEEQLIEPTFALFYRVPKEITGFDSSKVIIMYYVESLVSNQDAAKSMKFAISDTSDTDAVVKAFVPDLLLQRNLTKALTEGDVNANNHIALALDDLEFKSKTQQANIYIRLGEHLLVQGINWSYGRINVSNSISEDILKRLDRFDRRALIKFIYDLCAAGEIHDASVASLNLALEEDKKVLLKQDIAPFIAQLKAKLHAELFGDNKDIRDISEIIQQKILSGAKGYDVVYEKDASGDETFSVSHIEIKCTIGSVTNRIVISKSEDSIKIKAYRDESRNIVLTPSVRVLRRIAQTVTRTTEAVRAETTTSEIRDSFEKLLCCLKVIHEQDTVSESTYHQYCIAQNLLKLKNHTLGAYVTKVDRQGLPVEISVGLNRQTIKLIRRELPRLGEVWIYVVNLQGRLAAKIIDISDHIESLMNGHLASNDAQLISMIVNSINSPQNQLIPIFADILDDYESDVEDLISEEEDEDETDGSDLYERSLFDDFDDENDDDTELTDEQRRIIEEYSRRMQRRD